MTKDKRKPEVLITMDGRSSCMRSSYSRDRYFASVALDRLPRV